MPAHRVVPPQLPQRFPCRIAIIGEAPDAYAETFQLPFHGPAGQELNGWLRAAGISRSECLIDNVLSFRPLGETKNLLVGAKELSAAGEAPQGALAPVQRGRYLPPDLWPELVRINTLLDTYKPNVVVAAGALAVWALTGLIGVEQYCGHTLQGHGGRKIVPVLHPSAVMRAYGKRGQCIRAMRRAAEERASPELRAQAGRVVQVPETVDEVRAELAALAAHGGLLSFDIETHPGSGTVRSIAFSTNAQESVCVLLCKEPWGAGNYWADEADEVAAVLAVRDLLEGPSPKLAQNGSYDVVYLWLALGIRTRNYAEDTRLKHHAFSPEEPKDLRTLGARYVPDIGPWKAQWAQNKEDARDK